MSETCQARDTLRSLNIGGSMSTIVVITEIMDMVRIGVGTIHSIRKIYFS